jgi:LPXTG-site transpeptidase (sortase) family protein
VTVAQVSTPPDEDDDVPPVDGAAGVAVSEVSPEASPEATDRTTDVEGAPPARSRRPDLLPWVSLVMTVLCMFGVLLVGYLFVFTHLAAEREQRLLASHFEERSALSAASGRAVPDGTPVATLAIPALGLHQIVVAGTSAADLEKGPGLMPRTAPPGVRGNTVIAGRRVTFGMPFAHLLSLQTGDTVKVVNGRGTFTYLVVRRGVARPGQPDPVAPSTKAELTLVTSPPLSESGREYVVARLVGHPLSQPPYVITRPDRELALSGDASAVPGSIVWGLASLLAVAGTIVAYRRWPHTGTIYLLSTPILLATAVLWFEHLAQLLPASF